MVVSMVINMVVVMVIVMVIDMVIVMVTTTEYCKKYGSSNDCNYGYCNSQPIGGSLHPDVGVTVGNPISNFRAPRGKSDLGKFFINHENDEILDEIYPNIWRTKGDLMLFI